MSRVVVAQVFGQPFFGPCEACGRTGRVMEVFEEDAAAPDQVCVDEVACLERRKAECAGENNDLCWCMGCTS